MNTLKEELHTSKMTFNFCLITLLILALIIIFTALLPEAPQKLTIYDNYWNVKQTYIGHFRIYKNGEIYDLDNKTWLVVGGGNLTLEKVTDRAE